MENPLIRRLLLTAAIGAAGSVGWKVDDAHDQAMVEAAREAQEEELRARVDRLEGRLDAMMNREEWGRSQEYVDSLKAEESKQSASAAVVEALDVP